MITLQDELDAWVGGRGGRADVAATIAHLATACTRLSHLIGRGPLAGVMTAGTGPSGGGDAQTRLDLEAHELVATALREAPVAAMLSEEAEAPEVLAAGAPLAVAIDPLDGSSNIDTNVPLGTIFGILPAPSAEPAAAFRLPGTAQLAAGFAIYGPCTALVLGLGEGTVVFTLDRDTGRFLRTRVSAAIPMGRPEYAINASNYRHWAPAIRA